MAHIDDGSVDMVNHPLRWVEVVRVPSLGACWEWDKSRCELRGGYGQVRFRGRIYRAHRLAYELWIGQIPHGHGVLHHCDNPPCIRPDHLFTGTDANNARDMVLKERGVNPVYSSQDSPAAKLTLVDVEQIRMLLAEGHSLGEIGRIFHVTKQAIARIKKGETWTMSKTGR